MTRPRGARAGAVAARHPGRRTTPRSLPAAVAVSAMTTFASACSGDSDKPSDSERPDDPGTITATLESDGTPSTADSSTIDATGPRDVRVTDTIASNLDTPWGIAFLPDGDALVTQRDDGTISRITPSGRLTEVGDIPQTFPT